MTLFNYALAACCLATAALLLALPPVPVKGQSDAPPAHCPKHHNAACMAALKETAK